MAEHGIPITNIGVESPEQIGTVERHGGLWKSIAKRVIASREIVGPDQMRQLIPEICIVKNEGERYGGYSPAQWVLGRAPNRPGGRHDEDNYADLGILESQLDPDAVFAEKQALRLAARKAFVKADSGKRVARAVLRKSAPVLGEYKQGDIVCYWTKRKKWSTASRIIGFEGEKIVWLLTEGVPVCAALDKIRPAFPYERASWHFLHSRNSMLTDWVPGTEDAQQGYVDARDTESPRVFG